MSQAHEPSADDLIARRFAGRFVRRDDGAWFDRRTAEEVVAFCANHGIAIVRTDAEWDWPEGRQHAIYDNRTVLQRSLTWQEVLETCTERTHNYLVTWVPAPPGLAVSFTWYTEVAWQEHDA